MGEQLRFCGHGNHERLRCTPRGELSVTSSGKFRLARRASPYQDSADEEARERLCATSRLEALADKFLQARRQEKPQQLDYLILVPTLRCNLTCEYCQVSRAALNATGYDWSEATLAAVQEIVSGLQAPSIKIEFQGGEPTLRIDLIEAIIASVPEHIDAKFVICSNLERIDDELLALLGRKNVSISTSLDGPEVVHQRQRTAGQASQSRFRENLRLLQERFGLDKVSALPTIDPINPPEPDALIDAYGEFGFTEIYLRPINYQGFARKAHAASRTSTDSWLAYHERVLRRMIERNFQYRETILSESYFTLILNRIFRPGYDRHVDLRNPNPLGIDYVVIDYDGQVYPTDEARMLSRSRVIDLAIGNVWSGWDSEVRASLNAVSTNVGDPACDQCAYQPYCGRDIVDDISRYGTIDVPRHETDFCRKHMHLFDLAFELIYSDDPATRYSLARWLGLPGNLPDMRAFQ